MSDLHQDENSQALAHGRKLATTIRVQLERFYAAPFNLDEGRKLDNLQKAFLAWEQEAVEKIPADALEEFNDPRLRPRKKIASQSEYLRLRNQWTIDELRALPARLEKAKKATHADSGMWGGIPGI